MPAKQRRYNEIEQNHCGLLNKIPNVSILNESVDKQKKRPLNRNNVGQRLGVHGFTEAKCVVAFESDYNYTKAEAAGVMRAQQ